MTRAMRLGFRAWIDPRAELGPGCELGYGGLGVVIDAGVSIGERTFISHNVTIGRGPRSQGGVPRVGAYVYLGAGAQLAGDITVGDFAIVGANAVVEEDVARGAIVAGNPARELRREGDPVTAYERETGERVGQAARAAAAAVQERRAAEVWALRVRPAGARGAEAAAPVAPVAPVAPAVPASRWCFKPHSTALTGPRRRAWAMRTCA